VDTSRASYGGVSADKENLPGAVEYLPDTKSLPCIFDSYDSVVGKKRVPAAHQENLQGGLRNKVGPGMVRNKVEPAACKENSPSVLNRIIIDDVNHDMNATCDDLVLIVDDVDDEHEIVAHWKCMICKYASNDRISDWCESCGRHF
jgi:hypothetical protein